MSPDRAAGQAPNPRVDAGPALSAAPKAGSPQQGSWALPPPCQGEPATAEYQFTTWAQPFDRRRHWLARAPVPDPDRIVSDAALPDLAGALPALHRRLATDTVRRRTTEHAGLLTGNAGVLLTLHTLTTARPVDLGWETCLLAQDLLAHIDAWAQPARPRHASPSRLPSPEPQQAT
ncbi:hypothetical protein ABZ759_24625 [Streptomyces sp. NPDC047860]|uniref:hypothetical protein n=1 Tax=Streptomyces sp. NPDC047860 TaxID=3155743 RepID=UPI0033F5F17F